MTVHVWVLPIFPLFIEFATWQLPDLVDVAHAARTKQLWDCLARPSD